ncbi:MAG TPA: hypothetical protein VGS27_14490 [Candidatus Sulfotelmatobacter sp.]|nr:hypothetical protein [Candidatus Sulfotelmatobacter sp.]
MTDPNTLFEAGRAVAELVEKLKADAPKTFVPPSDGTRPSNQFILPHAMVRDTRGYVEKIVFQINGCYEKGWFDGCAVMMRRLLETLIIECFEEYRIADRIKNQKGDFFYLSDLIDKVSQETAWNLGRNTKTALPKLKNLGDMSAHSRRYTAHREDIDKVSTEFRNVCQELLYLAKLK